MRGVLSFNVLDVISESMRLSFLAKRQIRGAGLSGETLPAPFLFQCYDSVTIGQR